MENLEPIEVSDEQFEDELKRSVLNNKGKISHDCCCNCRHQRELRKHPSNQSFGKGSIMDSCGWVCLNPEVTEGTLAIYSDRRHGLCELYSPK